MINDTKVGEKEDYMWHRIRLNSEVGEKDILAKGWNTVQLRWLCKYNTNQVGLHKYVDKQDGNQYLFSDFEAYSAHEVFPCFD